MSSPAVRLTVPGKAAPKLTPAQLMAREQVRVRRRLEQQMWEAELADTHRIDAYQYEMEHG